MKYVAWKHEATVKGVDVGPVWEVEGTGDPIVDSFSDDATWDRWEEWTTRREARIAATKMVVPFKEV